MQTTQKKSGNVEIIAVLGRKECEVQMQQCMHAFFGMSKNNNNS